MRRLLVICALIAGPTMLVGPALLPGRALLPADLLVQFQPWRSALSEDAPAAHWDALVWDGITQFYPWRHFAAESLRSGVIPLWNPYQFCGTPFLANGQSAVLYPLNLLFWAMPVYCAFGWSAWLHLCLTGWFVYRLLRRFGVGRVPALCGCVVWQLNSFTIAWIHLPTVLCTVAWLPAILLMCERALVSGRSRFAVAAGVGLGLSYLGGHPQMFMYVALMTGAFIIARGLPLVRLVVSAVVLAAEILRRGLFSVARDAVIARTLLRAALLAMGRDLVRVASILLVTTAVGLGLASVQLLPTLDFLRVAHRAVTIGPESYQAYLGRAFRPGQLVGLLLPHPFGHPGLGTYVGPENYADYCLYVGLVALGIAAAAILCRTSQARFFGLAALASLLIALGTAVNWPLYHWLPGMASAGGPSRVAVLFAFSMALLAGMGVGAIAGRVRQPRLGPVLQTVLLLALAGNLLVVARGHVHVFPREWVYSETANPGPVEGRIIGNAVDWPLRGQFPEAALPPNAATVYHLRDAAGYDSLYLARYRDFASLIQSADPSPPANGNMILFRLGPGARPDMARLAGVGAYLMPTIEGEVVALTDDLAFPRAWVTSSALSLPTHRQALAALADLGATRDYVVITGKEEPAGAASAEAGAQVTDLSPNAVEVTLSAGGGYLFLADAYAPGWHAYAGSPSTRLHQGFGGQARPAGKPLRVMPADATFRAVAVPREATEVVFRYEPASFRVGLFVSLVVLAVVVGLGGALWADKKTWG